MSTYCGTSGGLGPLPSDPDSNLILTAKPAFGGIDVTWTYPETNPQAVAHTIIYRSTNADPATMIKHQIATGDFYYDKVNPTQNIEYFYWVQWVSINGTYGDIVGPVSAIARPTVSQTLEMLTGQIASGALAQSLKEDLTGIDLNREAVLQEEQARVMAWEDLSYQFNQLALEGEQTLAALQEESTARLDEDTAIVNQTNQLFAQSGEYTAQVEQEFNAFTEVVNGDLLNIGASFSMKLGADGLIGGFGLNNDGSTVEAGFDVDRFWVGRTGENKRKPFIIENGEVFMDEAVIKQLTFDKLRSEDGSLISTPAVYDEATQALLEPGKLKAAYIDAEGLEAESVYGDLEAAAYVPGESGWRLTQSGNAEFNNAEFRGAIEGSVINGSTIRGSIINGSVFVTPTDAGEPYLAMTTNLSWGNSIKWGYGWKYSPFINIYSYNYSKTSEYRRSRKRGINATINLRHTYHSCTARIQVFIGNTLVADTGSRYTKDRGNISGSGWSGSYGFGLREQCYTSQCTGGTSCNTIRDGSYMRISLNNFSYEGDGLMRFRYYINPHNSYYHRYSDASSADVSMSIINDY